MHERVCAAVERSGIKKKVIADRIGVSEQTFSAMLAGRRKISADEFFNLCLALNTSPNELYGFNQNEAAKAV